MTNAPASPRPRLGELLLSRGLITHEQLAQARADQVATGGALGRHLILRGAVTRRGLYTALAEQWGIPVVDLISEPPQPEALAPVHSREVIARGWIPWRRDGDRLTVATSVPWSCSSSCAVFSGRRRRWR